MIFHRFKKIVINCSLHFLRPVHTTLVSPVSGTGSTRPHWNGFDSNEFPVKPPEG